MESTGSALKYVYWPLGGMQLSQRKRRLVARISRQSNALFLQDARKQQVFSFLLITEKKRRIHNIHVVRDTVMDLKDPWYAVCEYNHRWAGVTGSRATLRELIDCIFSGYHNDEDLGLRRVLDPKTLIHYLNKYEAP